MRPLRSRASPHHRKRLGELVAQGWLERRGQAGTFVARAAQPGASWRRLPAQPGRVDGCCRFDGAAGVDLSSARAVGAGDKVGCGRSRFDLCTRRSRRRSASRCYRRLSNTPAAVSTVSRIRVLITGSGAACLILRTLAQPGQHMWMEDPGIPLSGRSSRLGSWRWMRFR